MKEEPKVSVHESHNGAEPAGNTVYKRTGNWAQIQYGQY